MTGGKVTLVAVMIGSVLSASTLGVYFRILVPIAIADNVNTAVTVLNTPPTFNTTGYAHEESESSTSTPTNVNARLAFRATATDSSNDNYWLIICKTAVMPTPNTSAAPTCNGGMSNEWAVSGQTASGVEAVAATTTKETIYWATESNNWYGYVCDGNTTGARCSPTYTNTDESNFPNLSSPFVINHPPVFSAISNNSPQDPGGTVTWTATATDTDRLRGVDQLTLFVCRTASFSTSTGSGCNGGAWATSTPITYANSIATSTPIPTPTQDRTYNAFVYVADDHNLGATSTNQASASNYVIRNVTPTVDAATLSLVGTTTNLGLYRPASTSGPYTVQFIVTDNNSCVNASSGNEISVASTSVFHSPTLTAAQCQTTSDFNTNRCYPSIDTRSYITCTQDTTGAITGNACSGSTDATVGWSCTFQLWFNADATTANSTYSADTWKGSVTVVDDNYATSSIVTGTTGTELDQFLAFDVTQTSIGYGGVQPGSTSTDPFITATSTDLKAQGNVGLDEYLYGDTMCPNWSNSADYCDHAWGAIGLAAATSTILSTFQRFATDTIPYSSGKTLTSSTSPTYFALQVPKTIATTSIQSRDTLWSIFVPSTITRAGDYSGVNTIYAAISNFNYW